MKSWLIYPMAFYVFFMFCILLLMFRTRVRSIKSGEVDMRFFKGYTGGSIPEYVNIVGRHYDNQFQVPQLFFVTCLTHLVVGDVSLMTVILAWIFIATRIAHSFVHLGKNRIQKRLATFAAGWVVIAIMWGQLLINILQSS